MGEEVARTMPGVTEAGFPFIVDPLSMFEEGVDVLKLNAGTSGSWSGSGAKKYLRYMAAPMHRKKPSTANAVIHHILLPFRNGWVKLLNMFFILTLRAYPDLVNSMQKTGSRTGSRPFISLT